MYPVNSFSAISGEIPQMLYHRCARCYASGGSVYVIAIIMSFYAFSRCRCSGGDDGGGSGDRSYNSEQSLPRSQTLRRPEAARAKVANEKRKCEEQKKPISRFAAAAAAAARERVINVITTIVTA